MRGVGDRAGVGSEGVLSEIGWPQPRKACLFAAANTRTGTVLEEFVGLTRRVGILPFHPRPCAVRHSPSCGLPLPGPRQLPRC